MGIFNSTASVNDHVSTAVSTVKTALSLSSLPVYFEEWEDKTFPCVVVEWLSEGGSIGGAESIESFDQGQISVLTDNHDTQNNRLIAERLLTELGLKRGQNLVRGYINLKDFASDSVNPPTRGRIRIELLSGEGWRVVREDDPEFRRRVLSFRAFYERADY